MTNKSITIENARIGFRNFSGKEKQYNPLGKRNFCIFLDPDLGKILQNDGWNVRWTPARDKNEEELGYLQVAINYENIPPKIVLISSKGKTLLNEDTISDLDTAEFSNIDIIIRPYNWVLQEGTKNEKRGVKAYVKSMYLTLYEDELENKYFKVPTKNINEDQNVDNPF